jgi:hypothetical protein
MDVANSQANRAELVQAAVERGESLTEAMAGGLLIYASMPLDLQASVMTVARHLHATYEDMGQAGSIGAAVLLRTSDFQLFKQLSATSDDEAAAAS